MCALQAPALHTTHTPHTVHKQVLLDRQTHTVSSPLSNRCTLPGVNLQGSLGATWRPPLDPQRHHAAGIGVGLFVVRVVVVVDMATG